MCVRGREGGGTKKIAGEEALNAPIIIIKNMQKMYINAYKNMHINFQESSL